MKLLTILFSILILFGCSDETTPAGNTPNKIENLEIPQEDFMHFIREFEYYTLSYNEKHEQADWVAYELTNAMTIKKVERQDNFRADPSIPTYSASLEDYEEPVYDRGHLAPCREFQFTYKAMDETFYLSNMSPQLPYFNRTVWNKLEGLVREWAELYGYIYVVTGPILKDGLPYIGENEVSVPDSYYKVILVYKESRVQAIGFIIPQIDCTTDLTQYIYTVDEVEARTGIDFYYLLPDETENEVENNYNLADWHAIAE
jgi:endonuclease G